MLCLASCSGVVKNPSATFVEIGILLGANSPRQKQKGQIASHAVAPCTIIQTEGRSPEGLRFGGCEGPAGTEGDVPTGLRGPNVASWPLNVVNAG